MHIETKEIVPGQSPSRDRKFLPTLFPFVAASYRVTRLGLERATRFIAQQLHLFVLAACLAACQTTGVSFSNAVLSSADAPREISGLLAKPEGAGPFPAVVLLHTCGGVKPHVSDAWPAYLKDLGYVTLTVDTFGSRGLGPCGNALHPSGPGPKTTAYHEITRDAYGAFDYLERQLYVKKDRIAVIGFSLGANAINSYLIHQPRTSAGNFKAAVGVYGRCHDLWRYKPGPTPLMELAGELDERHIEACRTVRPPIEVHVLPGTYHAWDNPQASGKADAYGTYMQYDRNATVRSQELIKNFLTRHLGK
ncbi:MAG: dienelactone hydrolase family protein [Burkholderiales bacterium]